MQDVETYFRRSFARDLKKIRDDSLRRRIKEAVEQVEAASSLHEIPNLTKLSGSSGFYRIRVGDYRIGIAVEKSIKSRMSCLLLVRG